MTAALTAFLSSEAGLAVQGLLVVSFVDFATGVFASVRDNTFAVDALAAFVRKHILGRVAPITMLLVVGYFGGAAGQVFMGAAIAAAAAYVTETAGSVIGNLSPPKAGDVVTGKIEGDGDAYSTVLTPLPVNPVPRD